MASDEDKRASKDNVDPRLEPDHAVDPARAPSGHVKVTPAGPGLGGGSVSQQSSFAERMSSEHVDQRLESDDKIIQPWTGDPEIDSQPLEDGFRRPTTEEMRAIDPDWEPPEPEKLSFADRISEDEPEIDNDPGLDGPEQDNGPEWER